MQKLNLFIIVCKYMLRLLAHFAHKRRFASRTIPFLLADIGEGIREVEIIQW